MRDHVGTHPVEVAMYRFGAVEILQKKSSIANISVGEFIRGVCEKAGKSAVHQLNGWPFN